MERGKQTAEARRNRGKREVRRRKNREKERDMTESMKETEGRATEMVFYRSGGGANSSEDGKRGSNGWKGETERKQTALEGAWNED